MLMTWQNGNSVKIGNKQEKLRQEQLARILHDFRSPLNIIIGFTELLLDESPGKINDTQRHALNDILDSSLRLVKLVNKIFDPSSPDYK
jgi:signal transduction histidine kinase